MAITAQTTLPSSPVAHLFGLRILIPLPPKKSSEVQPSHEKKNGSKKSPTGPTERTPKPEPNSSGNLARGPLVRSYSIFDGPALLSIILVV